MNNTYEQIKNDLTSKEKFHIKLGLERVEKILSLFDNPQQKIKTIHIAGTNGKGSTSAMLAKILQESGHKTGLFTSPHLVKYNERIKISSVDISDEDFLRILQQVNSKSAENEIPLTEFEILTVVAFIYFAEQKVDLAVIEVGLGGRLDATNVITPILEIITSISLDHTERLGDTIEKIAFEKAGIIKENSTVVVNQNNHGLKTIQEIANSKNATTKLAPTPIKIEFEDGKNKITLPSGEYITNLLGEYQGENLALVISAIAELQEKGIAIKNTEEALQNVYWPARMQLWAKNVIIDGAHNPAGAEQLRKTLDKYFPEKKRVWFFGALKNKDYDRNVKILLNKDDIVYFVKFNLHNSCGSSEWEKYCKFKNHKSIDIKDFKTFFDQVKNTENLIIIGGSLYLAGEVIALLDA